MRNAEKDAADTEDEWEQAERVVFTLGLRHSIPRACLLYLEKENRPCGSQQLV